MQCYGCMYHHRGMTEYGQDQPDECARIGELAHIMDDGQVAEQLIIILESMAFKLSELNNCPFFKTTVPRQRRSITDLAQVAK